MADPQGPKTPDSRLLRASLASLPAKKRLDTLLDFPNARLAVRRVPAEDLYMAIAEVGLEDSTEIVQLASPTQFRTFIDLAGWRKDRLVSQDVLAWLRAARGDEGEEFLSKVNKLDIEVLEFLLREKVVVHDSEDNPDANPAGFVFEMPEGKYLLELDAEGAELASLRQLINDLVAQDPFLAGRLFEAIRWEVPSELEETAFQFRSARLQDLGFPELYAALSIFAFSDPDKLAPEQAPGSERTELAPGRGVPSGYLEACFRDLSEEERPYHEEQLRYLINAALVAEGAEPGDADAIRGVSELARDYLALGLEHTSGGDPARAADAVRRLGFRRVFQAGFSLTLRLKFRADRLARTFAQDGVPLLLPEEANALAAVRRKRPLRALKVEGAEPVPFRSKREVAEIEAAVERAEHEVAIFRAVLGAEAEARTAIARYQTPLEELGADAVWMAIAARAAIGVEPLAAPFPRESLQTLGATVLEGEPQRPRLKSGALEAALQRLGGLPEAVRAEAERMLGWAFGRLRDEIGAALLRDQPPGREAEAVLPIR